MVRKPGLLAAVLAASLAAGAIPEARADRLGGNYRGPDDRCAIREDPLSPAASPPARDPLLASLGLEEPFLSGVAAGRREAEFRGRPLLVYLVLPGCDLCASVADRAFRDAEVLDLASRFVPVVADAEAEEAFGVARGVRTIPTILLLDAAGREAGRAEGAVDARRVAALLREGLRRTGAPRPTPAARALEKAAALLARAREAGDWRALLGAAAAIEKVGRDGPERAAARAALGEAAREAGSRLEEARGLVREGDATGARRALARIARDFDGLEASAEAAALLRAMEGPRQETWRFRGRTGAPAVQDPRNPDPRLPLQHVLPVPVPVAAPRPVPVDDP
jgi:hypothetical protein